jgi:2-oxoglutarate/2-oxoacid ferredoxin oxidoreductase subunit alpha
LQAKYAEISEKEQRYEEIMTDDAEILIVSYGTTGRICKSALRKATGRRT